jgi:DNA-binding transcriptional regulator YdaS (Cro superfamily)
MKKPADLMSAAQLAVQRRGVERAITVLGGTAVALANLIAVRPQFISQVRSPANKDKRISEKGCLRIEWATRQLGKPVLVEEIRPDVDWYVLTTRPRQPWDDIVTRAPRQTAEPEAPAKKVRVPAGAKRSKA